MAVRVSGQAKGKPGMTLPDKIRAGLASALALTLLSLVTAGCSSPPAPQTSSQVCA